MAKGEQIELFYQAFTKIIEPVEKNRKVIGAKILKQDKDILKNLKKIEVLCKIIEQAMGIGNLKQGMRYMIILKREIDKSNLNQL